MASTIAPITYNSTTTSFTPFTSPWTAPISCSYIYRGDKGGPQSGLTAFEPKYGISVNKSIQCLPSEFVSYRTKLDEAQDASSKTVTYLGPFRCPGNWTSATQRTFLESVTMTYCCPRANGVGGGYNKVINGENSPIWGSCLSTIGNDRDITYAYNLNHEWTVTTNTSTTSTGFGYHTTSYKVTAYQFVIGYNTAPMTTTPAGDSSSGNGNNNSNGASSGLSTGAKAGIGVGAGVGGIMLLALVFFLGRRRRDRNSKEDTPDDEPDNEGGAEDSTKPVGPLELDAKENQALPPGELQSKTDAPELEGQNEMRQELEGVNEMPPVELEASNPGDEFFERDKR